MGAHQAPGPAGYFRRTLGASQEIQHRLGCGPLLDEVARQHTDLQCGRRINSFTRIQNLIAAEHL
jgi:hypothetical protein